MSTPRAEAACWCGSTRFSPAPHASYAICQTCQTARLRDMTTDSAEVVQDEASLYGSDYWQAHMEELGFPSIDKRARLDMAERCNYWLRHVARYRLPPARVLEIGCAHGGFVKLLRLAGYDALGMEMSPTVIRDAQRRFGVEVVQGPIESVNGSLGDFDIIALFDVLEHFPDPVESMGQIVRHLRPGGVLVIQTPEQQAGRPAQWRNYKPPEHTYLFTRDSAAKLFAGVGLGHCRFEPALFEGDMFAFASSQPLTAATDAQVEESLIATPDGRIALALQDQYRSACEMSRRFINEPLDQRFGVRRLTVELIRALVRWPTRRAAQRQPSTGNR